MAGTDVLLFVRVLGDLRTRAVLADSPPAKDVPPPPSPRPPALFLPPFFDPIFHVSHIPPFLRFLAHYLRCFPAPCSSQNFPRYLFPSLVGRPTLRAEDDTMDDGLEIKDIMVGDEAARARHCLEVNYPVDCGIVKSWEDMEKLWTTPSTKS